MKSAIHLRLRLRTIFPAIVLFLLNSYICRGLFAMEYLRHMGSIEGVYIGLSRWAMAHWGDLSWFPLWYGGVPYQNTYLPLLHSMVALTAWTRGISPAHAYHWVTAVMYCLGPVTLYALALRLCGSRWAAFSAGSIYSLLSPSAWLVPAIAADLGSLFHPRRLQALVFYGEGSHVTALTLLPLALLFTDLAIAKKRTIWTVAAVLSLAGVALTNWLAAVGLALAVLAYVLARLGREGLGWRDLVFLAVAGAAAYCLAMPWIPPSTIAVIQANSQTIEGDFSHAGQALLRWGPVAVLALLCLKFAIRRREAHVQFAAFFTFLMAFLTLTYEWGGIAVVPQPARYHLELEMALALLSVFAGQALLKGRPPWMAAAAVGALALLLIQPMRLDRRYARDVLIRSTDIMKTSEWKTAQWLNSRGTGDRVLLPGSMSFWLLVFSDTPQIAGANDQGPVDPLTKIARYGIYTGEAAGVHDAEYSVLWLKALGVHEVGVSGPGSSEVYKPFVNPKKFEGVLDPLWREGGDTIYRVGQSSSLAHVIPLADAVTRTPINSIDVDPLRPYVAAIENPAFPPAEFQWTSQHSARITADRLQTDQTISAQIAWHPGWHASVNGQAAPIERDGLGFMLIRPTAAGPCVVELAYGGGIEMRLARGLSTVTAVLLALLSAWIFFKPKRQS